MHQTFDQRPNEQTPPGGCDSAGGATCFKFPALAQIVDVGSTIAAASPKVTIKTLSSFSSWSAANASQVVGLQWQLTGTNACTVDLTILNMRFLP